MRSGGHPLHTQRASSLPNCPVSRLPSGVAPATMAPMRLKTLRIRDVEHRWDSLSLSLHAIVDWAGLDLHYRAYSTALGHSFMTCSTGREDDSLAWWSAFGRDALLVEAAALFGVRVREVHPPEAARGLRESAEFAQHFEASYKPIILTALENGQPVLAWQGWPDSRQLLWGVITEKSWETEMGLAGTTIWAQGQAVPLVSSPVQLYVVEEASPRRPGKGEMLRFGLKSALRALGNKLGERWGVVTGPPAYDHWAGRLEQGSACAVEGPCAGSDHRQMARFVTYDRESAERFFQHYRDGLGPDFQPLIDGLLACCRRLIDALAPARDADTVEKLICTARGGDELIAGVRAAQQADREMLALVEQLDQRLAPAGG